MGRCNFTVNQETRLYFLYAEIEYLPRYIRIRWEDVSQSANTEIEYLGYQNEETEINKHRKYK